MLHLRLIRVVVNVTSMKERTRYIMTVVREPEKKMYRVYRTELTKFGPRKRAEYYFIMHLWNKIIAVLYCWRYMKWDETEKHTLDHDFRRALCQKLPI